MKHTKGNWEQSDNSQGDIFIECKLDCLCEVYGKGEEREANAKLIAAAPELLEQLNKIVLAIEDGSINTDHVTYSKELIVKATK